MSKPKKNKKWIKTEKNGDCKHKGQRVYWDIETYDQNGQ